MEDYDAEEGAKEREGDLAEYTLRAPAHKVYHSLAKGRSAVEEMGRRMANLTIPSVYPPEGYETGDDLPGLNQSFTAQCVNTLASRVMFMAFPPGQPIVALTPRVSAMAEEINADPELYAKTSGALSQLEMEHRRRFQSTALSNVYTEHVKLLLVAGNSLWKHIKLSNPTFHNPSTYVVRRNREGLPLITIHEEEVLVETLDEDLQEIIRRKAELEDAASKATPPKEAWEQTAKVYSVMKYKAPKDSSEEGTWLYWQECYGERIEGTEVETDFDDPPMWPAQLIPVPGKDWGRGYCEEYRGDLYACEANASSLNDIAALAGFALLFVKPSSQTRLRSVKEARNLEVLPGVAEDLSVFRSDKTVDGRFISENLEAIVRRLAVAFMLDTGVVRDAERVTKEEVVRVGRQLDRAMGGLYTNIAQGTQRRIIMRAMRLHEEENPRIQLPKGLVDVNVITGTDALAKATEADNVQELADRTNRAFGPGAAAKGMSLSTFMTITAASLGVKPEGLILSPEEKQQSDNDEQAKMAQMAMLDKATGPVAGAAAEAMAGALMGGQPQPPQPE